MIKVTKKELVFNEASNQRLLILYTGGTIGMKLNETNELVSFNFDQFLELMPELSCFNSNFTLFSFDKLIDSANMKPAHWLKMAVIIGEEYENYDGFVILQGTDTMAYSASALSFLLQGLSKPIIFTGAQLPIGAIRNDARNNIISSIEIALSKDGNQAMIQEVAVFFDDTLLRGNRCRKSQTNHLDAFESENYPVLATAGVSLEYNSTRLLRSGSKFRQFFELNEKVIVVKLFPGIRSSDIACLLNSGNVDAVILETYGAGNATTDEDFINVLKIFIIDGGLIVNVSQCYGGRVMQKVYQTGNKLDEIGVISGQDMTTEAALTKVMFVIQQHNKENWKKEIMKDYSGELTI